MAITSKSLLEAGGMRKQTALVILLSAIIIALIPISYLAAVNVVQEAVVYRIGFNSKSGSLNIDEGNVTLSGVFILENRADIPLSFDAILKVLVYPTVNHTFDGSFEFSVGPFVSDAVLVGNVSARDALAPPHGQVDVPWSLNVVSEDALSVVRSGNFSSFWVPYDILVTGSFLGWRIASRPAFQ